MSSKKKVNQDVPQQSKQSSGELGDPKTFVEYLELKEVHYKLKTRGTPGYEKIAADCIARAVILEDKQGKLMVIVPKGYYLDYAELCRSLCRDLLPLEDDDPLHDERYDPLLHSYPPATEFLKVKGLLDSTLRELCQKEGKIYLPTGRGGTLAEVKFQEFENILDNTWESQVCQQRCLQEEQDLANSPTEKVTQEKIQTIGNVFTIRRMKERLQETFELPIMPPMADELLKLRVDPTANTQSLARLVELDPSLCAQLISWASSPYYGYPGKITSIDDAIIKVLGYDLVMNIALGIAIGQVMRVPTEGPLGLKAHWMHALYSATLIEGLLKLLPAEVRPYRGLAYLCGLLHNFGFLLLGQTFQPQFHLLNHTVAVNPEVHILTIEHRLFSVDHQQIGGWLMENWHMPEELQVVVNEHHNEKYDGEYAVYVQLVALANRLLSRKMIGDELPNTPIPKVMFEKLQLEEREANELLENFWTDKSSLEGMINLLTK